ncbi:MAG TPA: oligosaccharide flippase family protein [Bryobacteraceae bacterium]|nr:oligosaccharide flippase family protein [Bryobacteraceae bacterium]
MRTSIPRFSTKRTPPAGRAFRSALVLAGGAGLGAAVVVACSPVLSRLYDPEAFGTLAIFVSLVSLLTTVGAWRYEVAVPLPDREEDAANLVAAGLLIVAVMGAAVCLAVALFGRWIVDWLKCPRLEPYLWLIPVAFVAGSAYQVLSAWALRHEAFEIIARTRVAQNCGMVGAQIAVGATGLGALGLLAGETFGRTTGVLMLARFASRNLAYQAVSVPCMTAALRRYVKFPILSSPASLLTSLSTHLPVLLLVRFFGPAAGGLFVLTTRVLGMPAAMLGQAVGQMLLARAARAKNDEAQIRHLTHCTATGMFAAGVVVIGIVALGGPALFGTAFGDRWRDAGLYARILAPWYLLWLVCNPLSNLLNVREWQGTTLLFSLLECTVQVGAIVVGARIGSALSAVGLLGAAAFLLALLTMERFFRAGYTSWRGVMRIVARPVAAAMLSLIPLLWLVSGTGLPQTSARIGMFLGVCATLEWRYRILRQALRA